MSSIIAMFVWLLLYFSFKESFNRNGFSYFFFLVHYPNYLLGFMLYLDIYDNLLNDTQIKMCFPIGMMVFGVAYILLYTHIPHCDILSAWATALATYLILYFLIFSVENKPISTIGKWLSLYGKNSYGIYLLHAFYVWPFISLIEEILNRFDFSIMNYCGFAMMIPIVLILCYFTGLLFNKVIKRLTLFLFK